MKFGVVVFPGSNCDHDCYQVVKDVLQESVTFIWHKDSIPPHYDCIILPGGFSYGDYLRTGSIARFSPVMASVQEFAKKGGLVIGICNGFQILLESGLLPGAMLRNRSLKFICRFVHLKVENTETPFTSRYKQGDVISLPIAHNEGCYYCDAKTLEELKGNGQIVFRYCMENGEVNDAGNPNGALDNIAGICNKERNVLGMMPHPERASEEVLGCSHGRAVFESIRDFIKKGSHSWISK